MGGEGWSCEEEKGAGYDAQLNRGGRPVVASVGVECLMLMQKKRSQVF